MDYIGKRLMVNLKIHGVPCVKVATVVNQKGTTLKIKTIETRIHPAITERVDTKDIANQAHFRIGEHKGWWLR
jgi:hypothetical protein